ncbi:MAG: sulfite exporter TauE/SafE family protein [Helicobacter sp.]|nr:sulfite exporter TauE/SafE family protein [Helicobacter sp.]
MLAFLIGISVITSAISAFTGVAGGIALIAIMPYFLPINAIIPLHGIAQAASNISRAYLMHKKLAYMDFFKFISGGILGAVIFGFGIRFVHLDAIPLFIGIYILLTQHSKSFNALLRRVESFYLLGFLQVGLGLFVGTPGPLAITLLNKRYDDIERVIGTSALMMSVVHLLKVPVYMTLGFEFESYIWLMIFLIIAAFLGSILGNRLLKRIDQRLIKRAMPWLLSILALQLIIRQVIKIF